MYIITLIGVKKNTGMISLRSSVTLKILGYMFLNSGEGLYANELSRKLSVDKRNLVKKLNEMEAEGILRSVRKGNMRLYLLDREYPLFKELKNIVLKTSGLEERLKEIIRLVPGIDRIYVFGSYAQGKLRGHSDIDILAVGEHSVLQLQEHLVALQAYLDREINSVSMGRNEFEKRHEERDPFLSNVLGSKHIEITG